MKMQLLNQLLETNLQNNKIIVIKCQQNTDMTRRNNKLSPILKQELSLIPELRSHLESTNINQQASHLHLLQNMKRKLQHKSKSTNNAFIIVRSQEEQELMNHLKPRVIPLLSPTNSITISQHLKTKYLRNNMQRRNHSTLVQNHTPKKAKNTELDSILGKKKQFMKTYFSQLKQYKKNPPETKIKEEISYEFPEVKVNGWKVRGFLRGNFILLKGWKKEQNHLPAKQKYKKYPYSAAWDRIRSNYQEWVQDKFCFQD